MTILQILTDNDAIIRQQTAVNSINQDEVADQLDALANELLARGVAGVPNTATMSTLSGTDYKRAFVTNNGMFEWLPGGVVDGVHVFTASGGGVWSRISPITSGTPIAANGLSTDGTGRYVLGQTVAEAGDPAMITDIREIPYNASSRYVALVNRAVANTYIRMGGHLGGRNSIFVRGGTGQQPGIFFQYDAALVNSVFGWEISTLGDPNGELILNDNTGFLWTINRAGAVLAHPTQTFIRVFDLTADATLNNSIGFRSRGVITNRGSSAGIILTLPALIANAKFVDVTIAVVSPSGHPIRIQAPGGVTIRVGSLVSPSGGSITSTANGDSVRLVQLNAAEWQAVAVVGSWTSP